MKATSEVETLLAKSAKTSRIAEVWLPGRVSWLRQQGVEEITLRLERGFHVYRIVRARSVFGARSWSTTGSPHPFGLHCPLQARNLRSRLKRIARVSVRTGESSDGFATVGSAKSLNPDLSQLMEEDRTTSEIDDRMSHERPSGAPLQRGSRFSDRLAERPLVSVVIPCYNESKGLERTLKDVMISVPRDEAWEVLIVDDGSTDDSPHVLEQLETEFASLRVLRHEQNRGYGAALKTGFARAQGTFIATLDADGSYPADRMPALVKMAESDGLSMVIGARQGRGGHSPFRAIPKSMFRLFVTWLVNRPVPDFNSGMRVVARSKVLRLLQLLPDGFSLTTTLTIALMRREPDLVAFENIPYQPRIGRSKIRPFRDTLQFVQLIVRTGMFFAPMRALLPLILLLSTTFLVSAGYDVFILQDLTDKTVILLMFTLNTGLFALIADMIAKNSAV